MYVYTLDKSWTERVREICGALPDGFCVEADTSERVLVWYNGPEKNLLKGKAGFDDYGERILCGTGTTDTNAANISKTVKAVVAATQRLLPEPCAAAA